MGLENPKFNYFHNESSKKVIDESSNGMSRREFLLKSIMGAMTLIFHRVNIKTLSEADKNPRISKLDTSLIAKNIQPKPLLTQETSSGKKKESAEKEKARKITEEILRVYGTQAITGRMDKSVLSDDFFMALQFQESRNDPKAESIQGAQGVFQNLPISTQAVVLYLSSLRAKNTKNNSKLNCDYKGPDSISIDEAKEIGRLLKEKSNYGRALGKLYLLAMHDPESKFNQFPNRDVFRSRTTDQITKKQRYLSPAEQQDLLALSYHDGPARRLNPENATNNGKNYLKMVHKHLETISQLRKSLKRGEMSPANNYAISKILKELDRPENQGFDNVTNQDRKTQAINRLLKKLQNKHMEFGLIGPPYKMLPHSEIDKLFEKS